MRPEDLDQTMIEVLSHKVCECFTAKNVFFLKLDFYFRYFQILSKLETFLTSELFCQCVCEVESQQKAPGPDLHHETALFGPQFFFKEEKLSLN